MPAIIEARSTSVTVLNGTTSVRFGVTGAAVYDIVTVATLDMPPGPMAR